MSVLNMKVSIRSTPPRSSNYRYWFLGISYEDAPPQPLNPEGPKVLNPKPSLNPKTQNPTMGVAGLGGWGVGVRVCMYIYVYLQGDLRYLLPPFP